MLKVSESWSARISWKICKKNFLNLCMCMYTYVHARTNAQAQIQAHVERPSVSPHFPPGERVSCSPLCTQVGTHLSVPKDPCVSKYKSTGYRAVSTHPALHQSGGSEFRSSQLHDSYFTRGAASLGSRRAHFVTFVLDPETALRVCSVLIFIALLCQEGILEKNIWSRNEKNVSHPSSSGL